ncbi:MAG: biotin--[acetyl-CoA-carboxylase] ligase, partial [Ruminococcaceae bacterium]|nr:biotin--[acetyl-CoA-carboxylase] ligase [Oscillospiraceae bacterium]
MHQIKVISKKTTVSTNTDAREFLRNDESSDDFVIIAETQTGGRGRQGKSFLSPSGGLYMTLA